MNSFVSSSYDGRPRLCASVKCCVCEIKIVRPVSRIKKRIFCSSQCYATDVKTRRRVLVCGQCGKHTTRPPSKLKQSKSGVYFCCRKCKDTAQRIGGIVDIHPEHYADGKYAYRNRALRELGEACQDCGYAQQLKMLDVHHKDGDRLNNELKNLEVLCVWCHGLRTRKVSKHRWTGTL
jgi:hypothetical protein